MGEWAMVLSSEMNTLMVGTDFWTSVAGELRMPFAAYLGIVIIILMAATSFRPSDAIPLRAILIAAFGWPVTVPVLMWRAWDNREP